MLTINFLSLVLLLPVACADQPQDILTVDSNQVDSTRNTQGELLHKARTLKSSGKSGYGAMYRRAAWASLESLSSDNSETLAILDELKLQPESMFDQWDGLRIEGRVHLAMQANQLATASYEQAELLAITDPSLIDSHPLVYIEIMQQQSGAFAAIEDFTNAANCAVRLRDHASESIHSDHRLLAAQSACMFWLAAGKKDRYIASWDKYNSLFPSIFNNNQGVWLMIEHAKNLSSLGNELTAELEDLFVNPDLKAYNNYIEIGEELAWAWLEKDGIGDSAQNFAYSTLQQTWNAIEDHESTWLDRAGPLPVDQSPIKKQVKSFIGWYAAMAYERDDFQTLESLGHAYAERYGYEDGEAINMINLGQNP